MSVTSPSTRFSNMRIVLRILYENNAFDKEHALKKQFIADKMERTVSVLNNALSMLREIKLVSVGYQNLGDIVFLEENGRKFYKLLRTNNNKEIKDFSIKLIKESNSLLYKESYKLLKREPDMSHDTLGREIRKKIFNDKKPQRNSSYANNGRTIKDIFCGMQIIDIDIARIRRINLRGRTIGKLYAEHKITHVLDAVKKFTNKNTWQIKTSSHFAWDKEKESEIARTLIDLNIAFYYDYDSRILKLTDKGEKLKNNLKTNKRKNILKFILLDFPPIKSVIIDLIKLDREFSSLEVGGFISDFNKINWANGTKIQHGSTLISWLKEAEIVVNSTSQFRYKISDDYNIEIVSSNLKLDWSLIDDKQFEDLCCDLLKSLDNFENVIKMGGAPGDLKRDISAIERIETTFEGVEYRKYLVQCKRYIKTKVTPDELPGLVNALPTHDSDGLLIMTSNELTPNARIYLENINKDKTNRYKAKWVEKNKLEELIKNKPEIMKKYF